MSADRAEDLGYQCVELGTDWLLVQPGGKLLARGSGSRQLAELVLSDCANRVRISTEEASSPIAASVFTARSLSPVIRQAAASFGTPEAWRFDRCLQLLDGSGTRTLACQQSEAAQVHNFAARIVSQLDLQGLAFAEGDGAFQEEVACCSRPVCPHMCHTCERSSWIVPARSASGGPDRRSSR